MKVTVCFGNIRVVVPCGSGDLTVRELQDKACARYRKAAAKAPDYHVQINQLESSIDGGILDADDMVCDVVEDKERLIAIFEEDSLIYDYGKNLPLSYQNQTGDPKQRHSTFQNGDLSKTSLKKEPSLEIDVNTEALRSNTRVMVRKENGLSSPSHYENIKSPTSPYQSHPASNNGGIYDPRSHLPIGYKIPLKPQASNESSKSGSRNSSGRKGNLKEPNYFRRDLATRQSMGSGLSETLEDLSVAYHIPIDDEMPSPVYSKRPSQKSVANKSIDHSNLPWFYRDAQDVTINERNINAIKVGSFIDRQSSKFAGLLVHSIDENSRIAMDDLLMRGDVIVEINEHVLMDFAFEDAEAMLIESLRYPQVQFRVLPVEERDRRTSVGSSSSSNNHPSIMITSSTNATPPSQPQQIDSSNTSVSSLSTQQSQSPAKPTLTQLAADNVSKYTKKIGRKINVQLKKDIQGLGFTLTSRDTSIGGPGPIYIKQILPTGAAIKNGKLQPGDRLLDVNSESVIGKSQQEVVSLLRAISIGSTVNITISRQNEDMPRKIKDDPGSDKVIKDDNMREYFVFEIPLNDTGSAGLGISLKGNQSTKTGKDMGIFVRAVLRGGAAWQDGRLQPNDQLIEVNGHSLSDMPNRAAIDVLTNSMVTEGNMRGMIEMVIARRRKTSDESNSQVSSEASGDMSDVILDHFLERAGKRYRGSHSCGSISYANHLRRHGSVTLRELSPLKHPRFSLPPPAYAPTRELLNSSAPSGPPLPKRYTLRRSASFGGATTRSQMKYAQKGQLPPSDKYNSIRRNKKELRAATSQTDTTTPDHSFQTDSIIVKDDVKQFHNDVVNSATDDIASDPIKNPDVVLYDDEEDDLSADYEPFSRESTLRQSISEKRKDAVPRLPNQRDSGKKGKRDKSTEKHGKIDSKNEFKMNGKISSPRKDPPALMMSRVQKNNNNSAAAYAWKLPQPGGGNGSGMRKSASSESLLEQGVPEKSLYYKRNSAVFIEEANNLDVGPSLGIAKSSSLESLQTAMENLKHSDSKLPMPRPLTKVVRGRVLNDSFRAALDQSCDVTQEFPKLKPLETLCEYDAPNTADPSKPTKKRTKIFGLFKGSKSKREDADNSTSKLSETELHKLNLDSKRAKDFEKMKAENERISAKAKEFRHKQMTHHRDKTKTQKNSHNAPVSSSYSHNLENFYSKAKNADSGRHSNHITSTSSSEHHTRHKSETFKSDRDGPVPPPVPKHHKRNKNEKYSEANAAYNSLPRPARRESLEIPANSLIKIATSNDRNSFSKTDNLAFYNRNKPSSVKKHASDSILVAKKNIGDKANFSPENTTQTPEKLDVKRRRPSRTERRASQDASQKLTSTPSYYQRESSPGSPPQSFYVVQEKKDSPGTVVVRRGVMSKKSSFERTPPANYRHSIFTDQPASYQNHRTPSATSPNKNKIATPRDRNSWMHSTPEKNRGSSSTPDRSMSTPDSEIADRNRQAYFKLMHGSSFDDSLDKIEVSDPYNL